MNKVIVKMTPVELYTFIALAQARAEAFTAQLGRHAYNWVAN